MHQTASSVARLSLLLSTALASACAAGGPADIGAEPVEDRDAERASDEVLAQIDDAATRWSASCPQPHALGPCVRFVPAASGAPTCEKPALGRVEVVDRNRSALEAEADLRDALAMAEQVEPPTDPEALAHWREGLGRARIATIDAALEDYFSLDMPSGHEEFAVYFKEKTEQGKLLINDLTAVKQIGDDAAVVRAALRTAWVSGHFVDQLVGAEVPAQLIDDGRSEEYCAVLREQTAGPSQMATSAAGYCSDRAAEAGFEGPEVEACANLESAWSTER